MEVRPIDRTANEMKCPPLGFVTWRLQGETCVRAVRTALDCGVRLLDTATFYGNESEVGRAVREAAAAGIDRESIFVTTKLYPDEFARAEAALEASIARLDVGTVDMVMLHHPGPGDLVAYRVLEQAAARGLVRTIGLSNWYADELSSFLPKVDVPPLAVQNEIHPFYQERSVVPFIQAHGIVVQSWYPLGGRGWTKAIFENETIRRLADRYGKTPAQIVLRWHCERAIVPIPGSADPKHIRENADIFDFLLTPEDLAAVEKLDRGEKHDWY